MKRVKRSMGMLLVLLILGACASLIPLKVGPPKDITIEATPDRLARGEYLVKNVMGCLYCHSEPNFDYWGGGLPKPGTEGAGGWHDAVSAGIMGSIDIYFSNITPAALGDWTDGEIVQALTEGVSKGGKPLFPIMPYGRYRHMPEEEIFSIVAYLRTLKPIENPLPKKKVKRMFKVLERTFPQPWEPQPLPDPQDEVAYGKYLATIGDCVMCHTTMTKSGKLIEGMDFAGGNEYKLPNGQVVYSANITPDEETGIGHWSREDFIEAFKQYVEPQPVVGSKNTIMAWSAYAGMTEEDLGAIYAYLRSVPPVEHEVNVFGEE